MTTDYVVLILMDQSKVFDGILHDLIIAKQHVYGFNENTVNFIYLKLKTIGGACAEF